MFHYNLVHKQILIPKAMQIPEARAAVDKDSAKLQMLPAWDETKVHSESELVRVAKKEGKQTHFATLTVLCDLKNSEVDQQFPKYGGRVVL